LLLYFPLLPDLKILIANKDKAPKWMRGLYRFMGSFWKGTASQFKMSNKAITILCVMIIPVAFAIHTVTSWLFATTYRPGWDSTN
jgi:molybdopterin-containing oxidoreductase family membrane subunit